jgi:hypothetical protein
MRKPFRQTEIYKKKLMRVGAALRRFSNVSGAENNFNSLSLEVDSLEELSLSTFSLMKAIKKELTTSSGKTTGSFTCACGDHCKTITCLCRCHNYDPTRPGTKKECSIIRPFALDMDEDDSGGS